MPGPAWLQARLQHIPEAIRPLLTPEPAAEGADGSGAYICDAARRELVRALAGEGDHRGAFHLLAADGHVTLACQAALLSEDADAALAGILDRILA